MKCTIWFLYNTILCETETYLYFVANIYKTKIMYILRQTRFKKENQKRKRVFQGRF
jgi:hypothetical protein